DPAVLRNAMQTIGIAAKTTSRDALEYARKMGEELRGRGLSVIYDEDMARELGITSNTAAKKELGRNSDLLITFGGDGTLLSVARHAPEHVPIIGVNMGTLGFLTEIRVEEFPHVLDRVLAGEYHVEPRVTFEVSVSGPNRDSSARYRVLNDCAINKSAVARIIDMRVSVAGLFVSTFRGDGLIVATPTGSTAYNLSAGGPIIYPTMGAVVITPICPHMLTNRPLVLPDELDIEIALTTPDAKDIFLSLDGQEGFEIGDDDRVCVRKSEERVLLVQSPDKNYFDVLRNKLKWGEG
ncbi:MAG TPA: NAD(+)/NADH kinase, partial [Thermoanaerobaculia bacterium]|nr:NAD(+)/NADH kinase [Thermoanaerobaculia bacterium]